MQVAHWHSAGRCSPRVIAPPIVINIAMFMIIIIVIFNFITISRAVFRRRSLTLFASPICLWATRGMDTQVIPTAS